MTPQEIHASFKAKPGSKHIASAFAISEVFAWVERTRPNRVLEVGAGIGTLTFALARLKKKCPFELVSVEWNDFCLGELDKNLAGENFTLVRSMDGVSGQFDLIVIDGGAQDARFVSNLSPRGVIFIEGFMDKKHNLIHDTYRNRRKYAWTNIRSKDHVYSTWAFQFEPTLAESAWYAFRTFRNRLWSAAKRRGLVGTSRSI